MDNSTAAMGHRLIFPVFFVTQPHYAPQKIKKSLDAPLASLRTR